MNITTVSAANRIETFAREGRLVQNAWHSAQEGKELACLLGAIDPSISSPADCPAEVMPRWCASALVTLFDGVSQDRALDYGLRFASALRKTASWNALRWQEAMNLFLIAAIENAVESATPKGKPPAYWADVQAACTRVVALLKGKASKAELDAAADAAYAARAAADAAARAAAYAAAYAAADAAYAARAAAYAAAYAAYAAADAAYAARAAARAAYAARAAAYEKLFDRLLSIMEAA